MKIKVPLSFIFEKSWTFAQLQRDWSHDGQDRMALRLENVDWESPSPSFLSPRVLFSSNSQAVHSKELHMFEPEKRREEEVLLWCQEQTKWHFLQWWRDHRLHWARQHDLSTSRHHSTWSHQPSVQLAIAWTQHWTPPDFQRQAGRQHLWRVCTKHQSPTQYAR